MAPHPSGQALPVAIQALHAAIAEHQDPQAKATLATCLQNMLKVQASDMQQSQGGQQQQPAQGGQQAGNPIAALLAARMGGAQ